LLTRRANSLSGGEAQRANLARALCLQARVTLLDEPLAGLDGPARRGLLAELPGLLREFASTTVLVTHEPEEALRLSDRVVILSEGAILAEGETREVLNQPPNPATAAFLGFDLLPWSGGLVAAPAGALRLGPGSIAFEMVVDRVFDLGPRIEVGGTIDGCRVAAYAARGAEAPGEGERVPVHAEEELTVRFSGVAGRGDLPH
jgi:ABC-type antimicrobial peptide transport system ATPase subunit